MLKYVFLICLSFSFAYSIAIENVKITKKSSKEHIKVNNTVDCGGDGTFLGLRIPGCVTSPCSLPTNVILLMETDFRLSAATPSITFTNNVLINGIPVPIFVEVIHGPFDPTNDYTIEYTFTQSQAVILDIRFTLHAASQSALIICKELTLEIGIEGCLPAANGISQRNRGINTENILKMDKKSETFNVEGVRICGSNGNFNELFVPGCSTQPCKIRVNQFHTMSFLFHPSRTSRCVVFEQFVNIFGQWVSIYQETSQENLIPGNLTLLAYDLFAVELSDFRMPLRSVLKTDDGETELCFEFDVIFHL